MSEYEKIMRKFFEMGRFLTDKHFVDKMLIGKLNDVVRVKLELKQQGISDSYPGVLVTIINKSNAVIDVHFFNFVSVWGIKVKNANNVSPFIRERGNSTVDWFMYTPTDEEYKSFYKAVSTYVRMFE